MTFLALVLLGAGLLFVSSALSGETLGQTISGVLSGTPPAFVDASGTGVNDQASSTTGLFPTQFPGGPNSMQVPGYPVVQSEGAPAGVLHNAWNYCVETAGAILWQLRGGPEATGQSIATTTQDMVSRGLASGQAGKYGVSNFTNESTELNRLGFRTHTIPLYGSTTATITAVIADAVQKGIPIGVGMDQAWRLHDDLTGKNWNGDNATTGVHGHAIVVEGTDASGVYAADPNTPEPGRIVHYSWENLHASGLGDALVPS